MLLGCSTDFPPRVKDYGKIEWQNSIDVDVFGYENKQFYLINVSKQHNEDVLNLIADNKRAKTALCAN